MLGLDLVGWNDDKLNDADTPSIVNDSGFTVPGKIELLVPQVHFIATIIQLLSPEIRSEFWQDLRQQRRVKRWATPLPTNDDDGDDDE